MNFSVSNIATNDADLDKLKTDLTEKCNESMTKLKNTEAKFDIIKKDFDIIQKDLQNVENLQTSLKTNTNVSDKKRLN